MQIIFCNNKLGFQNGAYNKEGEKKWIGPVYTVAASKTSESRLLSLDKSNLFSFLLPQIMDWWSTNCLLCWKYQNSQTSIVKHDLLDYPVILFKYTDSSSKAIKCFQLCKHLLLFSVVYSSEGLIPPLIIKSNPYYEKRALLQ